MTTPAVSGAGTAKPTGEQRVAKLFGLTGDAVHHTVQTLVRHRAGDRTAPVQPRQARGVRMRHRTRTATARCRAVPDQVLSDRDVVHRLRHRDRLPLPLGRHLRHPLASPHFLHGLDLPLARRLFLLVE